MKTRLFEYKYLSRLWTAKKAVQQQYRWIRRLPGAAEAEPADAVNNTVQSRAPHRAELLLLRLLIVAAIVLLYIFIKRFFAGRRTGYYPLYVLLCVSLGYKLVKLLFEWYHYWAVSTSPRRTGSKSWKVDMLTTAMPGEPYEMIENTLRAMVCVRYPHTTYLCDEGDDPELKQLCARLGVVHVTRRDKINAKAGNINHALQQATGEICVVLDPDHAPLPQFLDEVLPYFDDPKTGFVQVAQVYKNAGDTWIAQGAAQQTYVFYGPMMMGMNSYGTAQAIGANCSFRRQALDSIGGHAAGLSEDMHTAMRLHAAGWKSVYLPRVVTRGLVPANISAYYKQQLKWSRGTFELLFAVFPLLFTRFSRRQQLHYFLLPFHFAAGIIALIDILIPVIVLFSGEVPLYFNSSELLWILGPLLFLMILIRQYAQRWLLEKHERGFHLAGGILLFGTWWVYTVGFFYTLLRIKVPYIPTPKEDDRINNLRLHIPNIIVCLLCITAVLYGLSNDWNPYNFAAAGFALLTVFMLCTVIMASQQLFLLSMRKKIYGVHFINITLWRLQQAKERTLAASYRVLRRGAPLLGLATLCGSALLFTVRIQEDANTSMLSEVTAAKKDGGFYTGIYLPALQVDKSPAGLTAFENATRSTPAIISLYEAWGQESLDKFPLPLMNAIAANGSIPMITWEPWMNPQRGMAAIASGSLDDYIRAYAKKIRDYNRPVFIRFAHEPDNPAYPWSATGGNTPGDYKAAWHKVGDLFAEEGVNNVTWVWNPWNAATMATYYPGDAYVDWIGVTCLNYGGASWDGRWHSFESIYNPYRTELLALHKPVMLAEFGSTNYGGSSTEWLTHAMQAIHDQYTEIRSFVFFNSDKDKNWVTPWRPSSATKYIDWSIRQPELLAASVGAFEPVSRASYAASDRAELPGSGNNSPAKPAMLKGSPGSFTLLADGKPFYIKGIAYNPGQGWRDGHYPLTIKQLRKDFTAIKQTGCNTIRRYRPSIYDRNILKVAQEDDLKVLYGFWFDPQVDYYKDSVQVDKYIQLVEEKVAQYKTSPVIISWCIGDQTSSGLANYYVQPYLGIVQNAYWEMIGRMAQSIHRLDPLRPVMTTLEHSRRLPAELLAYRQAAPSVDVIGINSFYQQQLSALPALMHAFDSTRPYLVAGFGPQGYWDSRYTGNVQLPKEENDLQKAGNYASGWNNDILSNKGNNIGGVAFCWRDRFEGSATWFGITDYKGRRKAAYYALQQVWAGKTKTVAPVVPRLFLVGPGFPLGAGQYYAFTAVYDDTVFKNPEWHLYREDCVNELNGILPSGKSNKAWISIPSDNGKYRLYVYLEDKQGNVVSASIPIIPYKGTHIL
ncbi:MAG TPA: glycosyltransferase [Mucilaginibacter sp.]